jgi:hypothetical protein
MFLRTVPHSYQGKGCKLCPEDIYGFYRWRCGRNFKKGSFDWKIKGLVPFSVAESDLRATNPPLSPIFSPNILRGRRRLQKGLIRFEIGSSSALLITWLVPFVIIESEWKATIILSTPPISPNISNQKFWDRHFVHCSLKFSKLYLWAGHSPRSLQGKGYKLCPGGI